MIPPEKLKVGLICQFYNMYLDGSGPLFLELRTITHPIEAIDADSGKYLGVVTDLRYLYKYNTPLERVKYQYNKDMRGLAV